MNCRHCKAPLEETFVDLGSAPPSNAYLTSATLRQAEAWYPLKVLICNQCWLVQTEDTVSAEAIFHEDYAYFSSCSKSWLKHAKDHVNNLISRFSLNQNSTFCEIASNDGYLLQYVKAKGIPCYGIEPTQATASKAISLGIETLTEFFDVELAEQLAQSGKSADLIVANNVLAHVPNINNFVSAFSRLLKADGVAVFEFPHLLNLVNSHQFDTIYHEHFSYLSLTSVSSLFETNGLSIFDAEELGTHGGSLRIYACRSDSCSHQSTQRLARLRSIEVDSGMTNLSFYHSFQSKVEATKNELLDFLLEVKNNQQRICAYGAAAKGNTFLNFSGIRPDLIPWVVDVNPAKQGKYMPGSRLPIVDESKIKEYQPDYVLILPWNLTDEIMDNLSYISKWGGQFVTAIPKLTIHKP